MVRVWLVVKVGVPDENLAAGVVRALQQSGLERRGPRQHRLHGRGELFEGTLDLSEHGVTLQRFAQDEPPPPPELEAGLAEEAGDPLGDLGVDSIAFLRRPIYH